MYSYSMGCESDAFGAEYFEGQEAIGRLVTRFPDLDLAEPDIEWKPTSTIRGPKSLALAW